MLECNLEDLAIEPKGRSTRNPILIVVLPPSKLFISSVNQCFGRYFCQAGLPTGTSVRTISDSSDNYWSLTPCNTS